MTEKSSSKPAGPGNKVLIVEDQAVINHMLSSLLEQNGYNVVGIAEDGIEAVNMYNKERPDLVLMDIYMPHLDGLDAMQAIYKINPDAKIVIISSDGHQNVISKAMKLGAVDYIVKPIHAARLMQVVRKYLV
jgi:two-component system chemotaxis response regulator CheY